MTSEAAKVAEEILRILPRAVMMDTWLKNIPRVADVIDTVTAESREEIERLRQRIAIAVSELAGRGSVEKVKQQLTEAMKPENADEICETCGGIGTVDETLGGHPFANPYAPCPDCNDEATGPDKEPSK